MNKITAMNQNISFFIYLLFALLLIIFAGLRPLGFDADLNGYYGIMENIIHNEYLLIEPAFIIITKLSYFFVGIEYYQRLVVVVFAIIHITTLAYAFMKLSKYPFYSLIIYSLLFYPILGLTQIRYSIIVSLFLIAIPDIINKKAGLFYLKILIAFSFHYSAIIFLPFYFLNPLHMNTLKYKILLYTSLVMPFLNGLLFNLIIAIFNLNLLPEYVEAKIYSNLINNYDTSGIHTFNIMSILLVLFSVLYLYFFNNIKNNTKNIVLLKVYILGIFLYMILSFSNVIAFRMLNGIAIVIVLLLSNTFNLYKEKNFVLILIIFISIIIFFNTTVRNELLNWNILI